ncbi:MAG TPA: 2-oxoacid:acceptor oxidoreductase subunit alpha [Candidatus Acidoferrales bacterium]|nr:2-oxoacid:acceptor oxidoreductase subunit alpha [Candidatus Acidoferrales bacterium]
MSGPLLNELTIQAATVNGSGSQTANLVLTRAIFSMGIPVAPKNIFPSNIEGLPTWYQLRITPEAYMGRKDVVDILVAFNPATWQQDLQGVRPGGVVVHEEAYSTADARSDLTYYPVPFAKLAKTRIESDALRKQLANMLYVGVLAGLLDIPWENIEHGVRRQFLAKPKAVDVNLAAIKVGLEHWQQNLEKKDSYRLQKMTGAVEGKVLVEGNQAAALGVIMGGATVGAWYPITPSSSLCEYVIAFAERFRSSGNGDGEKRISIVQAEDELAAVGMAIGAGWAGARAFTSTSGPGISLMAEFSGLAYYAEVPVVIFDIQRIGPSTGLPTRTSQADLGFVYTLSHGDTKHLVLLPGSVEECYEFGAAAFDLADRFQTPVFVLSDLDLGMNLWMTPAFKYPEKPFDRGKVLSAEQIEKLKGDWGRYRDVDGDGVPYRTLPGTDHPDAGYFTRGSGHDEEARYTESAEAYARNMDRLARKFETARGAMPEPVVEETGAAIGIMAFGSSDAAVREARELLGAQGLKTDYLRVRALPLSRSLAQFVENHARVYVVEQNRDGQLYDLIRLQIAPELAPRLRSIRHYDGQPIPAVAITRPLLELEMVPV